MSRPSLDHKTIIRSFFWHFSAEELATGFRMMFHTPITAARLKDIWIEESAWNPFLQMDRPANGFKQTEEIKFWETLAAHATSVSTIYRANEGRLECV
jgi:hypothetical protein